jgi:hypothetical protein
MHYQLCRINTDTPHGVEYKIGPDFCQGLVQETWKYIFDAPLAEGFQ